MSEQFNLEAAVDRLERSTEILERVAAHGTWNEPLNTAIGQTIQINRWWLEQRNQDATT